MVKVYNDISLETKEYYPDDDNLIISVGKQTVYPGYIKFLDMGMVAIYVRNFIESDITVRLQNASKTIIVIGKYRYTIKVDTDYSVIFERDEYTERLTGAFIFVLGVFMGMLVCYS